MVCTKKISKTGIGIFQINNKAVITAVLMFCLFFCGTLVKAGWKEDANARIEQIRKRDALITVVDSNGMPVPDINVQIEQVKHHFGFGTCLTTTQVTSTAHQNFVRDHFEWAVCENDMKWSSNEATRDVWNFTNADTIANWCANNDIKLRGHTLIWETGNQTPSWVPPLPCATYPTPSEKLEEVDERISYTVNRYAGKIVQWDINNEMLSGNDYDCLGEAGRAHMFNLANSVDPDCVMMMNEYAGNSFGGYDGWTYRDRANGLIALGAAVEGLGIQAHIGSPFDPERYYSDVLEPLAEVGLPIMATEFDTDASSDAQAADDLENLYRICFSHPLVEGIIMWGYDQNCWRGNGIVNSNTWVLNQAGVRYEALLDEWTTEDADYSDLNGEVNFRGFQGIYDITLSSPGQTTEIHTIQLDPGSTTAEFILLTDLHSPVPDNTPPTPDPLVWSSVPTATGSSTITMTATTATDTQSPPVQYYFECTNDASKSSSWQSSTTYIASSLTPLTQYTFRVKARDSYLTPNETDWSGTASATTLEPPTEIELLGSWVTGTSHAKEDGYSRALIFFAHAEHSSGIVTLNSVTYGGQPMTKIIDEAIGTGYSANVTAFILDEAGIAAATSGTFVPAWDTTPGAVAYNSIFIGSVDQANPIGAGSSASSTSSNPITAAPLDTAEGDMVFAAVTCGNLGSYTLNNGFTEGFDSQFGDSTTGGTGAAGYKAATGAAETPSATYSSSINRHAIIGFVVKAGGLPDLPPVAPTGLIATAGNQSVSLDWDDNTEADLEGYNIYRSTTQGSGYSKINGSIVINSYYIDSPVDNWTPYYYVVTAVDDGSNESGNSNEANATADFQNCSDVLASPYRLVSDIAGNCYVDINDLAIIVQYWLETDCASYNNCEGADLGPDGNVNFFDFSDFALDWLNCNDPENPGCTPNW